MNKRMFYLLPFLAVTQIAASTPLPHVEVANLLNVLERVRLAEVSSTTAVPPKPVSGRNTNSRRVIKVLKPRAGRNASRSRDKLLIRRQ